LTPHFTLYGGRSRLRGKEGRIQPRLYFPPCGETGPKARRAPRTAVLIVDGVRRAPMHSGRFEVRWTPRARRSPIRVAGTTRRPGSGRLAVTPRGLRGLLRLSVKPKRTVPGFPGKWVGLSPTGTRHISGPF